MPAVRPKKQLGQHFLNDKNVASRIVESLNASNSKYVLEIGPGMGVLSGELLQKYGSRFYAAEVDVESVEYLKKNFPQLNSKSYPRRFS